MLRSRPAIGTWIAALLLLLPAGCATHPKMTVDWRNGPFFQPTNFSGLPELPVDVLRVALLPPAGLETLPQESASGLIQALRASLGAATRFEIVYVDPALVRAFTGRDAVQSVDTLPSVLFERIARDQAADAVLFVDLTLYHAYPPLGIGLRAKLVRLTGNRPILWAFDQVFDTRTPSVANSARAHINASAPGHKTDTADSVLQSPSGFASYVFDATFATLPHHAAAPKPQH